MYGKNTNGYTQHIGLYFKVSGSEYTFLSPNLDVKNFQEEFNGQLFQNEDIQPSVDGVDVSVIVNNKDNKITTTVESVNDLTGTTLINQVYLQPSTGNKYSAFDISSSLLSTDGFTHIYEGTLPANTVTSNHCITSIVSTDTCDTSIFDDLLEDALFIYSVDTEILGEAKYRDINGVDDVDANINVLYNQVSTVPNSDLLTVDFTTPNPSVSICDNVAGVFEIDDNVTNRRFLCNQFTPVSTTSVSYTIDLELISKTSGNGSLFVIGDSGSIFDSFFVDATGALGIKNQVGTTVTTIVSNVTNILNNRTVIGITKSGTDLKLYLDGVYINTYTSGYSATQIGILELSDETSVIRFNMSRFYIWDSALTDAEQLAIYNEKYL